MIRSPGLRPLLIVTLAAALAGCSGATDNLPRQRVSGTVTFEGKPLESGSIQFVPGGQDAGTPAGGIITGGRYEIARNEGPTPGTYKVMIFTTSAGVSAPEPEAPAPAADAPPGEFVPPAPKKKGATGLVLPVRYNHQTELTAKVEAGGANTFDYKLTK